MNENPERLWLHAYSGRENGLMVIGDRQALEALGNQLVAAAKAELSPSSSHKWPVEVAHPSVAGPYKDVADFTLSFHLEGLLSAKEILPLRRRNLPAPFFITIAAFALIGFFAALRWVVANAL